MVKCLGFVTWFSLHIFFQFPHLAGRNSGPIDTFHGSNDVFCFVHVPFQDLKPSNSLSRVLQPQTKPKLDLFSTWPICSGNRFSIRAVKSKLPLNVKITPQKLDF